MAASSEKLKKLYPSNKEDSDFTPQELGQAQMDMANARGPASVNKDHPDYKGKDGEKTRQQDRKTYKYWNGVDPEEDYNTDGSSKKKKDK